MLTSTKKTYLRRYVLYCGFPSTLLPRVTSQCEPWNCTLCGERPRGQWCIWNHDTWFRTEAEAHTLRLATVPAIFYRPTIVAFWRTFPYIWARSSKCDSDEHQHISRIVAQIMRRLPYASYNAFALGERTLPTLFLVRVQSRTKFS